LGANEAVLIANSHSRARRDGDNLTLTFANGHTMTLHNDNKGCEDGPDHCDSYMLAAEVPQFHWFLVFEAFYEGGNFYLIDDRSGRKTRIPYWPVFSPDGQRILIQNDDEVSDHDNNLEIWRRDGDGAVLEWSHSVKQANAELPSLFGFYYTSVANWRGDRIDLALSSTAQFDVKTKKVMPAQNWTGMLIHENGEWKLQADWPAIYRPSSASP